MPRVADATPSASDPTVPGPQFGLLGTPLTVTTYADLADWCHRRTRQPGVATLEFTNTHIVTSRRHEPAFRTLTDAYDWFIPDATPLVWCLRRQGAAIRERVYGPTFMRECFVRTTADFRHYLLGADADCAARLKARILGLNPAARFVGGFHGRCSAEGILDGRAEQDIPAELERLSPDFIWVGLGTPKQDAWVRRNRPRLRRGIVLSVGFAFDVNAGTKPDAPAWMQRAGLTWVFRLLSEPRRLAGRYAKYNSLFLWYLFWDGIRGKARAVHF